MINKKLNQSAFLVYEPQEDSYLLEKHVRKQAFGRVLDLGTGSGIQALAALSSHEVGEVVAVDIDEEAVNHLKNIIQQRKLRKIKAIQSDLFENVERNAGGRFNTIIFNPPYLPQDKVGGTVIEDQAIYGGKKGWEISERFFNQVSSFLAPDGKILFLFSSLTNKNKINEIIQINLFQFKELDSQKLPFEELFVYEITKTDLLRGLEARHLEQIRYFTKGKRGVIYTAIQDSSKLIKTHFAEKRMVKVAIKIKRKESQAEHSIENEVYWLKRLNNQGLNNQGIGPKLLFYETSGEEDFLVYEFVDGKFILDWIQSSNKPEIIMVLTDILNQCYTLDVLGVNKEEMHHPLKHIIITKNNKPVLIDFERTRKVDKPQNVTQFIEFICRIESELAAKGLKVDMAKLRELAGRYKETRDKKIIDPVISSFG